MSKILLLEDDLSLINGLTFAFQKAGFELDVARTIKEADAAWTAGKYDLLILDVSLPDGSGFDMGGDDYITKPFKVSVLMSRINALLRRANDFGSANTELHSNGIKVLLLQGQAYKNGELIDLTAAEYKLLCLFMQNPNLILSKDQILQQLWDGDGNGNYVDSNTLTVYIRRLRIKIEENPSEPQMLLNIRRMGYKWNIIC